MSGKQCRPDETPCYLASRLGLTVQLIYEKYRINLMYSDGEIISGKQGRPR